MYWPDQYVSNPFNPCSQVLASLQALADLNDNGGAAGKAAGLQQRLQALRLELNRADQLMQIREQTIEREQFKLSEASKKVDAIRGQIRSWLRISRTRRTR